MEQKMSFYDKIPSIVLVCYQKLGVLMLINGLIWYSIILMKYIEIGGWAVEPQLRIIRPEWQTLGFISIFLFCMEVRFGYFVR